MWHSAAMLNAASFLTDSLSGAVPLPVSGGIEAKVSVSEGLEFCGALWWNQFPPGIYRGTGKAHEPSDFGLIPVEIGENFGCKHTPECML
jgi:hypothetical protein